MIEVNASFQSVKTSVTSIQAQYQKNSVAYQKSNSDQSLDFLSTQENQVIDEVDISEKAIKALEDARALDGFLQQYLSYLKGDNAGASVQLVPANDDDTSATIAARSTSLSASITKVSYEEENLNITARFTDEGQLQELIVNQSSIKAEYVQAEIILEDRQLYQQS